VEHEPEFPALPLPGCPVFPVAHLPSTPLIGGQDGELVFHADFVADLPELPQGGRGLAELHSRFKADGVDHKVGMDVLGIKKTCKINVIKAAAELSGEGETRSILWEDFNKYPVGEDSYYNLFKADQNNVKMFVRTKNATADLYISMLTAMVAGRTIAGLSKALIFTPGTAPFAWVTTSLVAGIPGIVVQLILMPLVILALTRARLIPTRYPKGETV
jgi:hypothetical protein